MTTPDVEAVKVHIQSSSVPLASPPRDRIRTEFLTETVDDNNTVRPLLPDAPDRVCAYIQASGGDVYLCDSKGKAVQAADTTNSELGALLKAITGTSVGSGPWPIHGQGAVWIAQAVAASTCVVSVTAEYAVTS
jgi:hypothetical protein